MGAAESIPHDTTMCYTLRWTIPFDGFFGCATIVRTSTGGLEVTLTTNIERYRWHERYEVKKGESLTVRGTVSRKVAQEVAQEDVRQIIITVLQVPGTDMVETSCKLKKC